MVIVLLLLFASCAAMLRVQLAIAYDLLDVTTFTDDCIVRVAKYILN